MVELKNHQSTQGKLQQTEDLLSFTLWGGNLGRWDWDLTKDKLLIDARGAEMIGKSDGAGTIDMKEDGCLQRVFTPLKEDLELDEASAECHIKHRGDAHWVLLRGRRLSAQDTIAPNQRMRAFGTIMDVSADHAYQEKLIKLSITDPLTGLLNRRYFFDRFTQCCSQSKRDGSLIALALLDIDHFKDVNDQYGHLAGDEALCQISNVLRQDLRPYDLVSRFGGEEFIILFYGMDKDKASAALDRFQSKLRTTQIVTEGKGIYCTFSCGICDSTELDAADLDVNAMVKLADERLYYGKKHGRNRIVIETAA